ncbi:hypothetical protein [Fodinibius halophilus]|uniref:SIR2-like domain-containing protein n=1 Tax=Fodinibius halophilus TaxID=1736908 RepID=A0A6M1TC40_9BACT|nr:hypothetical protein [Fodinibius halophilus]NGP89933.1 hypothetical protein [Fodinibius halophilus]
MKSILIGNGINIQYGGKEYLNGNIIRRAINNVLAGSFPSVDYPQEVMRWISELNGIFPAVLRGEFDSYAFVNFEKESLNDLQKRYDAQKEYSVYEIGLEDYFLLHDLLCSKLNIHNPQRGETREVLKRFFLDAIYNSGKIQEIYQNFPKSLRSYLEDHDKIFTTNYDRNLENFVDSKIYHLHGSFDELSETYDIESFRNQISDRPAQGFNINDDNRHLYSNALMAYGGQLKEFASKKYKRANNYMDSMAEGYKDNPEIKEEINDWKNSSNYITQNLFEGITLKAQNPELKFKDKYPTEELEKVKGTLRILGLSPNNDIHLFTSIIENNQLEKIEFYCFDKNEADEVRRMFPNKEIETLNVIEFWGSLN